MNNQINFKKVVEFIDEMKATSSTNDKKRILKKYDSPFLRKLFEYTYSPFKQYHVTSANLKKRDDLIFDSYDDLFSLLDDLNDRLITGHTAIQSVNGFIEKYKEFSELIYDVIDRNLKTRATTTLINSVFPGTIPTFDVALAEKFEGNEKKINFESGEWWASRKLDGVRCITIIDQNGEPRFYSRAGNEFLTLERLAEDIKKLGLKSKVLDGEVCIMKEGGLEDFQGIIKEIGRKNHTIESPKYYIFDILELEEFNSKSGKVSLSARLIILNALFQMHELSLAEPLPQFQITSKEEFEKIASDATDMGYEGIMIRKNIGYEGKRSKNLLKVKKMHDAEYKVIDLESGVNRIIENNREVEEIMLKAVIVEHKGNRVRVGSGFSINQRRKYHENPDEILGTIITVQFFEETTDQHGQHSLRFPVFKAIYNNQRTF
jgi:DNA ligase-1